MNLIKKSLLLCAIIFLASPILACPKKRSYDEVYDYDGDDEDENAMMVENSVKDGDDKLSQSFKYMHISTRKTEEDVLLEEYTTLATQRCELRRKREEARYLDTPELRVEEEKLDQAFALHEVKAKQLREQTHPAMNLDNEDWDNDENWK
jgi:hypothetical protein